jgi:hypothetical protein
LPSRFLARRGSIRVARRIFFGVASVIFAGCQDLNAPVPVPLPPNIGIQSQPPYASVVDATTTTSFGLIFDRSMDPNSLRSVRRVSFLLPLTVDELGGRWNEDHTQLVFDLTQFPVQRGATYQVSFAGLRAADGELYNMGSYRVLFRTRGNPDLLPMQPQGRLAHRAFCHRTGSASDCDVDWILSSWSAGQDSLVLESRCGDCELPARRDWFRREARQIVWLGFDVEAGAATPAVQVRWPQPPGFLALPTTSRQNLTAADQVAHDGTALESWSARDGGRETPVYNFIADGVPVQVTFDESRCIDLEYVLRSAAGTETHRERWWLYPGVGLVRRERRVSRDGDPNPSYELETYTPSITDLLPH